ncbi:unnamed protein product, partial [Choristocarpus tenellus]
RNRRDLKVEDVEVDLVSFQPLLGSVNFTAIAEKVLREAPFAVGSFSTMWRAFLTCRTFIELATDGFWFVVGHEIQGRPVGIEKSPRFSRMAHAYSNMFLHAPTIHKDMWGASFFEAWALTLLLLLQAAFPLSKAMFDAPKFRMKLLDLCAEWTLGIRPTFPLTNHWVLTFDK